MKRRFSNLIFLTVIISAYLCANGQQELDTISDISPKNIYWGATESDVISFFNNKDFNVNKNMPEYLNEVFYEGKYRKGKDPFKFHYEGIVYSENNEPIKTYVSLDFVNKDLLNHMRIRFHIKSSDKESVKNIIEKEYTRLEELDVSLPLNNFRNKDATKEFMSDNYRIFGEVKKVMLDNNEYHVLTVILSNPLLNEEAYDFARNITKYTLSSF